MSRKRWMGIVAAAGVLLLGAADQAGARAVLQEDFRGNVAGRRGGAIVPHDKGYAYVGPGGDNVDKGSFVEYDLKALGFNPLEGTIELDLTRGEKEPYEALFSFADGNGDRLTLLAVNWEKKRRDRGLMEKAIVFSLQTPVAGVYHLERPWSFPNGISWPIPDVLLGRTVPRGETMHVALAWGGGDVDLFIDGKALPADKNALPQFFEALSRARTLIVGAQTSSKKIPGGAWSMTASPIGNVQVHDVRLTPAELAQPIPSAPVVTAVTDNAFKAAGFSGKLVAGDKLQVTVVGTPGATASFDIAHFTDLDRKITLDWKGYGTYLEDKTFFEEGEVNLRDVTAYRVYVSMAPIDVAAPGIEPAAVLKVQEQTYTLENLEPDTPYYTAVVAEMRDGTLRSAIATPTNLPMTETGPGIYGAEYGVTYQDRYAKAVVVGHLARGGAVATLAGTVPFSIDPALTIAVTAEPSELKADEKSVSTVSVTVTDANGNPVTGHKVKFLLATTSQYTGVVGGGAFAEAVGGALKESAFAETDLFGRLTTTYVAGFAAKTAVIVARDMQSNSTGAGYVKTYIQAAAELELEPVQPTMAMDAGYQITVTSSDEWLTADGKSQARITASVTRGGIPAEGHQVSFAVSSGVGSIRTVSDTTDKNGAARAVYTAGKKIGIVLITATDTTVGISGSVQIELRSDAPAKIAIKIDPEKLPADGRSRADISVLVTDINDNPNDNTEVEYRLASGGGNIRDEKGLTDKNGESVSEYVAGNMPGKVSIEITVRSTVPTDEELGKARDLALAVTDYDFF